MRIRAASPAVRRPALCGLLPAFSYPPCHAFVTPIKHNADSQKDLTPYREPAMRGLFVVSHSCG